MIKLYTHRLKRSSVKNWIVYVTPLFSVERDGEQYVLWFTWWVWTLEVEITI